MKKNGVAYSSPVTMPYVKYKMREAGREGKLDAYQEVPELCQSKQPKGQVKCLTVLGWVDTTELR